MKKIFILLLFLAPFLFSQEKNIPVKKSSGIIDFMAGMGVKAIAISDLTEYINSFRPFETEPFVSVAPEFYFGPEIEISDNYGLKFEYSYLIKTYENIADFGSVTHTVAINSPTIILHYLIKGEGYYFKIGGGIGYRFGTLSQRIISPMEVNFFSKGGGFKLDIAGHTTLGGGLYAVISAYLSADFMTDLKDDDGHPLSYLGNKVTLGSLGAAFGFGLSYYF